MNPTPEFLHTVPPFQALPVAALEEAAALSQARTVEEGGFFFMQGDEARHMYVLTAGQVKLTQIGADGEQVGMHLVAPGEMFAGIAVLNPGHSYPVNAEALEHCSALAWEGKDLRGLAERYPDLSLGIVDVMRGYVVEMQSRLREMSTERVGRRIARALIRLTAQAGRKLDDGGIEISLSQQDLAELSGTTLYTVSRTLTEWERQGFVETGRERVVIHTPHALARIAENLAK